MKQTLIVLLFFVLGLVAGHYFPSFPTNHPSKILVLKDSGTIFLDGQAMGVLYKGAQLTCIKQFEEGFNRAEFSLNYNSQPDSIRYYDIVDSSVENLRIPYWTSKDVSLK